MTINRLRAKFKDVFMAKNWVATWNSEQESFTIQLPEAAKPVEVSLPKLWRRMEEERKEVDELVGEVVHQIEVVNEAIRTRETLNLRGQDRQIFPVIRSSAFPKESKRGIALIFEEHTAESRLYYALDLGESYTLIDEEMLARSGFSAQEVKEKALFNLRGLPTEAKVDEVAGNRFYFITSSDGYAASRILNQGLLNSYQEKTEGDFCLAIPHQDVLIMADIKNTTGYDVLGQLVMDFYRRGDLPISMLPLTRQDGKLEPIFILAKKKPIR